MQNNYSYNNSLSKSPFANLSIDRKTAIGIILFVALFAFEIFNFDTTQYALRNLLGEVRFLGLQWAAILAIAFCSIDFAGLIRLFTPQRGLNEPKAVWYLMGAWLLGATMNAVMTWWAISLTLLSRNYGNEVLSREQLLLYVPIFVAILVWLTRILFIGAFSVAGEHIFDFAGDGDGHVAAPKKAPARRAKRAPARPAAARAAAPRAAAPRPQRATATRRAPMRAAPKPKPAQAQTPPDPYSQELFEQPTQIIQKPQRPVRQNNSRVRQRPPRPNGNGTARRMPMNGFQAKGTDKH